jgi:hypothetical protein
MQKAEEHVVEVMIKNNNANGNKYGPVLDNPIDDAKTLVAIDDPAIGIEKRLAAEAVPGTGVGYACLTGDTPIPTRQGFIALKDIKENDKVLTTSSQSTKVLKKVKNVVKSLVLITLCNGEQIKASPDHVFYNDKNEYVVSQNIEEGSYLLNNNGETIEVCSVAKKDTVTEVYDLITDDVNYSVGKSSLLTGTCILRFIAENKATYPNLYNNYKALDKAKRARMVEDLYAAKLAGKEGDLAVALNHPLGVASWKVLSGLPKNLRTVENINAVKAFESIQPGSLNTIETILIDIKSSRRQAFISGLESVADNALMQLTNSRLANADEVKDAVNNLRDFRANNPSIPNEKNVGTFEGLINNQSANQLSEYSKWISGLEETPLTVTHVWEAQFATGSTGTWFRNFDSEYKMLNDLARKIEPNAVEGVKYINHDGEIKIISELGYCTSCQGIIQKFNIMFPKIKIVLIDNIKF